MILCNIIKLGVEIPVYALLIYLIISMLKCMITKMCGFGQPKTIYKETTDL